MNELLAISNGSIGEETVQTVNARELHSFLGVGKDFSSWIKDRIEQYNFTENHDFVIVEVLSSPESGSTKARPQKLKEYALTLDMAKELSMVERNEKGKQARQYFIECERRAKDPIAALNDPAAMRNLLLNYTEQVIQRDKLIAHLQPQAEALRTISLADGSLSLTDAAKTIGVQPNKTFIPYLSANKWIYRRAGGKNWIAYQDKLQQMLLEHKVTTVSKTDGTEKITEQVRVTPKGLAKLAEVFTGKKSVAA